MKAVRSLLYLLVGFLLAVNVGLANAQTVYIRITGVADTGNNVASALCTNINQTMVGRQWEVPSGTNGMAFLAGKMQTGGSVTQSGATYSVASWSTYSGSQLYCHYNWTTSTGSGTGKTTVRVDSSSTPVPCPTGQVRDAVTGQCKVPPPPECQAGETQDFGVFPVPSGGGTACYGTCAVTHSSTPEGEGYRWTGTVTGQCSPVEQPQTCTETSANFLGYVNDKPFCADQGETPTPDPDPDPDPEEPGEGGDGSEGGCPDGQTWVPGTSGGAGSCVNGSGDGGGGDTGGGTGGTGGSGGTGGGDGTGDGTGTGGGDTGGGSGDGSGTGGGSGDGEGEGEEGEGPGYTFPSEFKFYEQKYEKPLGELITDKIDEIGDAPVVQLIDKLTTGPSGGGSCPSWSFSFNLGAMGNYGSMGISPPCWIWAAIKTIMIITALFAARRIVFGG